MERPIPTPDFLTDTEHQGTFRNAMRMRFTGEDLREKYNRPLDAAEAAKNSAAIFEQLAVESGYVTILAEAAESHAGAALDYDRDFRNTGNRASLEAALQEGGEAINKALESTVETAVAVPYHTQGKMLMELAHATKNTQEAQAILLQAIQAFELSTTHSLPEKFDYPLFRTELQAHLATAQLENAILQEDIDIETGATRQAEAFIEDVDRQFAAASDTQELHGEIIPRAHEKAVWHSGLWIRMGHIALLRNNRQAAQEAYDRAKAIINAGPDMTLRQADLAALEKAINPSR